MVDSSLKETYQKSTLLTDEYETIAKRRPRRAATQSVSYHARPPRARTTRTSTRKQSQPRSLPAVETPPGDVDASDEGSQETDSLDIDGGIQAPPPPTRIRLRIQSPESSSSPPEKLPKLKRKAGRPRKNDPNSKRHRVTLTASNRDKLVEPSRPMDDTEEAQQADNEMDEKTLKIGVKKEQSSVNNVRKNKDEKSRDIKEEAAEEVEVLDEKGEQKITKDGELLGGRKYRVPVFQLESRGNTIFMCSMEPAKCLGFRDSYLFFSKNPSLKRIAATDQEREWLVANGYLPTNFRNRAITLVSARSIFKLFGHRIVLGGKRRKDDYFESNINYDESHNSDQGQDSELESANNILSRRANTNYIQNPRVLLNETNWMYHQALSCRDFNNRLNIHRSEKSKFYDPHTNTDQFPRDTQPTRIRVEMTSPMNYSARKNNAPAPIEPEVEFVPKIGNPHKTLSAEVLEVIPPEIREIVETMKKNEELAEYHVEDKYPLSLMDGQFQTSYPVYQTRFKPDIQNVPMATTSNMPITPERIIFTNYKHNPALYCIHPLLGNVASYVHLSRNLGITRPVYGIQAPSDVESDIPSMARRYVKLLQDTQEAGPYFLCGYSYGGLVAWEMAKQLRNAGSEVGGLFLIDAPSPLENKVRPPIDSQDEPHVLWESDINQLLTDIDSRWMERQENEDPAKTQEFKRQIGILIASMYSYTDDITTPEAIQPFPIHYWRARDYNEKTSKLLLDHPSFGEANFGWDRYQGNITFHRPVTGNHYTILREETSGRLSREIDSNMPSNKKRTSSMDLKPLVLEKLATNTSRRSSRSSISPVSAKNSATSAFPLFKSVNESDDSLTKQHHHQLGTMQAIMNVKIPFPVMILMMTTFIWVYNHLTVLYASS